MDKILTVNDVAGMLQVKAITVREMFREKRLRGFKVGKAWRTTETMLQEDIEALARGESPAALPSPSATARPADENVEPTAPAPKDEAVKPAPPPSPAAETPPAPTPKPEKPPARKSGTEEPGARKTERERPPAPSESPAESTDDEDEDSQQMLF